MQTPATAAEIQALEAHGQVAPEPRVDYITHTFEVPARATRVTVRLRYRKQRVCQLFLSLFDPAGFRGCHMQPGAQGEVDLTLWVAPEDASRGGIPGDLPAGTWRAQIDVERTSEVADYLISALVEVGDPPPAAAPTSSPMAVSRAEAGWYRGELHAHSWESDGKTSVADLVAAARHYGLDYLALTDHFTVSGFRHLPALQSPQLALIRSMELTGHAGHANIHGITRWHDIFVDGRADWGINDLAREVREAGGLFCVNHAFAADLGWRYHGFDWDLADLIEVYHAFEGPGNLLQIGLWDEQLRQGRRVIGVAATDSHDPTNGRHRLGQILTAVYADELSEAGILAGLRRGRVYGTLGPSMDLRAFSGDAAEPTWMGGTAMPGPLRLQIELGDVAHPWRLHILKNGFFHALYEGGATAHALVELRDHAEPGCYYRAELHATPAHSESPYQRWREWTSLLAFSNPVFVHA